MDDIEDAGYAKRSEIARLKARLAELEPEPPPPIFRQSQLRDPVFFAAHRAEILEAARDGRLIRDPADARPTATDEQMQAARAAGEASVKRHGGTR